MKAAKIQNSIRDLNKDITTCERELSRVLKVNDKKQGPAKGSNSSKKYSVDKKSETRRPNQHDALQRSQIRKEQNHNFTRTTTPKSDLPLTHIIQNDSSSVRTKVREDSKHLTQVEVVVRTKPCKKRSRSAHNGSSRHQMSDNAESQSHSRITCLSQGHASHKISPSWSQIFKQQSATPNQQERLASYAKENENINRQFSNSEIGKDDFSKWVDDIPQPLPSNQELFKRIDSGNLNINDECDDRNASIFSPVRTLNFLLKELRGKIFKNSDEAMQRIVEDMEKALNSVLCENNKKQSSRINQCQDNFCNQEFPAPTKAYNLSETREKIGTPLRNTPGNASLNVSHKSSLLTKPALNASLNPEMSPHSSRIKPLDTVKEKERLNPGTLALQAQLEAGCKQLEETCRQMEENCNKLRQQRDHLQEELRSKSRQLDTALNKIQQLTIYTDDLRQEASREKLSDEAVQTENLKVVDQLQKQLQSLQASNNHLSKRLKELMKENERITTEMQLAHLEKDKVHVLMANKEIEAAKLKRDVVDVHALVLEQLDNLRTSDRNKTLMKLDKMVKTIGKLSETTDEDFCKTLTDCSSGGHGRENGAGEGSRSRPICSSPTSSVSSSLYSSWQLLSDITATEQNLKEVLEGKESSSKKLEEEIGLHEKLKDSGIKSRTPTTLFDDGVYSKDHNLGTHAKKFPEDFKANLQDMFKELRRQTEEAANIVQPSSMENLPVTNDGIEVSIWSDIDRI